MKILKFVLLTGLLFCPFVVRAQNISVTSAQGQNIANFINDNLVGQGVYVWNVKFGNATGNIQKPQIGTFRSNGYQLLQMDSGVVMTTGNVSLAPGPNNSGSSSAQVSGAYTDSQLGTWTGFSVTSCATVDFDFVSISPFVAVNYCFASEEYPEFVCSSFNDVFGFLITGPDPVTGANSTWNAAIIPHTVSTAHPHGIEVTINAVNQGIVGSSGTSSQTGCYTAYSDFYVINHTSGASGGPNNAPGVQYDGLTQKLSANATLVPCQQYHMHISVCNVTDNGYDSGVFLEKKSFNSPSADVNLSHRYADTIERSVPRVHPLTLAGSSYEQGNISVSFGGDAVVGQDYTVVTDSNVTLDQLHATFRIGTGNHSLTFRGTPQADLSEPKLIELYLSTSLCAGYPPLKTYDTIRFILVEDDIVKLRTDTIVAYDTCKQVGVELAIGQHPPFTFHWEPETDIDFPYQQYSTASITETTTYQVSVADSRGHTDTVDILVEVRPRTNGIEESDDSAMEVSVYPNPADDELHIEADGITLVEVYNAAGVCVFARRCNDDCRTLNISPLPAGMYSVRITTNLGVRTERVVVR